MKILTFTTVIASLLLISFNLNAQKKNVLDYYRMLDVNKEYKIFKNGEHYQTTGVTEEPFNVTVDFKNGYIDIKDEGTGGGTMFYQVVLYRKADGSALVAMSSQNFDGVFIDVQIEFYEEKDGKLVNKTEKYFPGKQFFMDKFPGDLSSEEKAIFSEVVTPVFDLPQHGLAISVMFAVNGYVDKEKRTQYDLQQRLTKSAPYFLKWKYNKAKDQFEIVES